MECGSPPIGDWECAEFLGARGCAMNANLPTPGGDRRAWVEKHQVSSELTPVHELVKGRGVQPTGYALKLFGRFGDDAQDLEKAVARAGEIYEGLRTLGLEAVRSLPVHTLVRVQPPGRAVCLPDARLVAEVEFEVDASPPHPDQMLPPGEVQRLLRMLEEELRSMGLKKRT